MELNKNDEIFDNNSNDLTFIGKVNEALFVSPSKNERRLNSSLVEVDNIDMSLEKSPAVSPTKRKRHGVRNKLQWKQNVRKRLCQSGKSYERTNKKIVPAKKVKNLKNCKGDCKFKCHFNINDLERERIFNDFYDNRSNINRQYDYIVQTSTCKENINRQSSKSRSFRFHFTLEGEPIRVCKQFLSWHIEYLSKSGV